MVSTRRPSSVPACPPSFTWLRKGGKRSHQRHHFAHDTSTLQSIASQVPLSDLPPPNSKRSTHLPRKLTWPWCRRGSSSGTVSMGALLVPPNHVPTILVIDEVLFDFGSSFFSICVAKRGQEARRWSELVLRPV